MHIHDPYIDLITRLYFIIVPVSFILVWLYQFISRQPATVALLQRWLVALRGWVWGIIRVINGRVS